ncbi:MAG: helix-turn-helix domain-containing protein [Polyangiaceae bacterium]|nr:helix-turn-helix domain-containing protein [Polyangiaceae bacterium]
MSNPDYMTAEQVAELLKVDRSYILQQCRQGKVSGAWKINPANKNSPWMIPTSTAHEMATERERNTNAQ